MAAMVPILYETLKTSKCCYIPQFYLGKYHVVLFPLRCPRKAVWQINSENPKDIYDYTESCDKHVGELLDDSLVHHVWRLE